MSKKPLLEENVARRWAKYAGIENQSQKILTEIYKNPMEEQCSPMEEHDEWKAAKEPNLPGDPGKRSGSRSLAVMEEDILSELEGLLEQDEDVDAEMEMDPGEVDIEDEIDVEDEGDVEGEEEEVDVDVEEEGAMSQEDVEDALKTGLEAMATAIGDALKIKIDVRSGGEEEEEEEVEEEEPEEEEDIDFGEEEIMETGAEDTGASAGDEGAGGDTDYSGHGDRAGDESDSDDDDDDDSGVDYQAESLNRNALVKKVMKRVAARLVKESKKNTRKKKRSKATSKRRKQLEEGFFSRMGAKVGFKSKGYEKAYKAKQRAVAALKAQVGNPELTNRQPSEYEYNELKSLAVDLEKASKALFKAYHSEGATDLQRSKADRLSGQTKDVWKDFDELVEEVAGKLDDAEYAAQRDSDRKARWAAEDAYAKSERARKAAAQTAKEYWAGVSAAEYEAGQDKKGRVSRDASGMVVRDKERQTGGIGEYD